MAFDDTLSYRTSVDVQRRKPDSSQKLEKAWALQVGILLNGNVSIIALSYLN